MGVRMTIDDFVSELLHSWNIPLNVIQSLRMKYSARPNVSVSYIANGDAQTADRLCHCDVTKRRLYKRADFPRRIRGFAIHN